MDKSDEITPGVPMLDEGNGPDVPERPHFPDDRLEPNPMFVDGPQLDGCLREGSGHRSQQRTQMLLEGGLRLWVGLHMARAGHSQPCTQAPQVGPAELTTNAPAETLAHPGGDRPPAPAIPLG